MRMKMFIGSAMIVALAACGGGDDAGVTTEEEKKAESVTPVEETKSGAEPSADGVEVTLKDELDGILNSYCLDIAGGNQNVDTSKGLQGHTCYSYKGELGTDQIFDPSKFASNSLYMPVYDVCATASGLSVGSSIGLAACEDGELQQFAFSGDGTISAVAAPELCLTLAEESRFGRGSQHQIKDLSLQTCSDELAAYQAWRTRTSDD